MSATIRIELSLSVDEPNVMTFADTYAGLNDVWYKFVAQPDGSVDMWATPQGFEHLARVFLKFARTPKAGGYHGHRPLEHGQVNDGSEAELTIGVVPPGSRAV